MDDFKDVNLLFVDKENNPKQSSPLAQINQLIGSNFFFEPIDKHLNQYICISYSWGKQSIPNPLFSHLNLSTRALSVLKTVIQALSNTQNPKFDKNAGIWFDAFSVPPNGLERTNCLKRMGNIYGEADHVIVVLTDS
ncbi:MAG: HET domain-containing protein, partial [Bacteroidota bacterium]